MRLQKAFEYPKIETAILGIGKQVDVDRFSVSVAKAQVCTSDQTEGANDSSDISIPSVSFNSGVTVS